MDDRANEQQADGLAGWLAGWLALAYELVVACRSRGLASAPVFSLARSLARRLPTRLTRVIWGFCC